MTSDADPIHLVTLAENMGCNPMELLGELLNSSQPIYASFPKSLDLLITGGRKLSPRGSLSQLKQGSKSISDHLVLNKPDFIEISNKDIFHFLWHKFIKIERSNAIYYTEAGKDLEQITPADYCLRFKSETELRMGVSEEFVVVKVSNENKSEISNHVYDFCSVNVFIDDIYASRLIINSISHILKCGEESVSNAGINRPEWMSEVLWVMNKVWYGILHQEDGRIVAHESSIKEKREAAEHALRLYLRNDVSENLMEVILQVIISKKSSVDKLTETAKNFSFELHSKQPQFLKFINGLAESFWTDGIKGIADTRYWEAARLDVSKRYGLGKRVTEYLDHIIVRDR